MYVVETTGTRLMPTPMYCGYTILLTSCWRWRLTHRYVSALRHCDNYVLSTTACWTTTVLHSLCPTV